MSEVLGPNYVGSEELSNMADDGVEEENNTRMYDAPKTKDGDT